MDAFAHEQGAMVGMILHRDYGLDVGKMPSPWCGNYMHDAFVDHPGDAAAVAFMLAGAYQRGECK